MWGGANHTGGNGRVSRAPAGMRPGGILPERVAQVSTRLCRSARDPTLTAHRRVNRTVLITTVPFQRGSIRKQFCLVNIKHIALRRQGSGGRAVGWTGVIGRPLP